MKKVNWDLYDMEELASMCEEKGLDSTGRRDDLVARLKAYKKPEPEPEAESESEPAPEPEPTPA